MKKLHKFQNFLQQNKPFSSLLPDLFELSLRRKENTGRRQVTSTHVNMWSATALFVDCTVQVHFAVVFGSKI